MPAILISILIAAVFLFVADWIIDSEKLDLKPRTKKFFWIVALILAIWYVIDPSILSFR